MLTRSHLAHGRPPRGRWWYWIRRDLGGPVVPTVDLNPLNTNQRVFVLNARHSLLETRMVSGIADFLKATSPDKIAHGPQNGPQEI